MTKLLTEMERTDQNIKRLVRICLKSGNFHKLAVTGFVLISNILDEIGLKLGIRQRRKRPNEFIFIYMRIINKFLFENIRIVLFKDSMIDYFKDLEPTFEKKEGVLPKKTVKEIYETYYEIRELNVPDLYEPIQEEDLNIELAPAIRMNSFLFSSGNKKEDANPSEKIKPLMIEKFQNQEKQIREIINKEGFNSVLFTKLLNLHRTKSSYITENTKKVKLKTGTRLKDSLNYQQTSNDLIGHLFLGAFILFLGLGITIMCGAIMVPSLGMALSLLYIVTLGPAILFGAIWYYYFKRGIK